jgi:hypothetical protein
VIFAIRNTELLFPGYWFGFCPDSVQLIFTSAFFILLLQVCFCVLYLRAPHRRYSFLFSDIRGEAVSENRSPHLSTQITTSKENITQTSVFGGQLCRMLSSESRNDILHIGLKNLSTGVQLQTFWTVRFGYPCQYKGYIGPIIIRDIKPFLW